MNIVMSEAIFIDTRGAEHQFNSFFIHARNIRYVHIPDELPIVPTIKNHLKKMSHRPRRVELDPKKNWKAKRCIQKQQETLKEVQRLKKGKNIEQSESKQ